MKKRALMPLLLAALIAVGFGFHAGAQAPSRVIKISAKRFSFTPNEITLKRGEPVVLELTTEDVTHGFYMKKLGIDEVIEPGKTTRINLTPQTPGRYLTICDHFCGSGHGNMNMTIVVE
jgi:cytochrome c oxidase subunit 2